MCTVTIRRDASEVLLTMNRDERRDRGPEEAPRLHRAEGSGVSWVGPADTVSGGTWLAASSRGLVACLLNGYAPGDADPERDGAAPPRSRGTIIPELLAHADLDAAAAWMERDCPLTDFASFKLVLLSLKQTFVFDWPGKGSLSMSMPRGGWQLFTSSSWKPEEVLPWRKSSFEGWISAGAPFNGEIPAYHVFQPSDKKEWAPLMAREHSATRSISQVLLSKKGFAEVRHVATPKTSSKNADTRVKLAFD